ncbi:MAG TPA: A24 family peptidase [Vicinamibacterales bacterium]|nr:A24 family peptidase [Vicinamibacterales bacterium]
MNPDTPGYVASAVFGLLVGSFLNVCIHRLPRRLSIVSPPSRCPQCGCELRWFDNIPVISYLVLRRACRHCRAPIPLRYPAVELITMVVFVAHYAVFGPDIVLVPRLLFASGLIVLFWIDVEHYLLPNVITLPGIAVGLAFSLLLPPGPVSSVLGILVGGGALWLIGEAYYRYSGQEGMGGGDVKMLAMIGAFLGWQLVLVTLVLSSIAGSLGGLAVIAARRGGLKHALPYGTFLALGALVASLFGEQIVRWYVGLYAL